MSIEIPENIDLANPEFQNAWELLQRTNHSVFLTGKAGTGKSTFLKYICKNTAKSYVVLAPTGIAAVNVGGVTMHSFFKMPLKPLLPDDPDYAPARIRKTLRYTKEKVKLLRNLDLIIIDEISMVRADMIDFMDRVLRTYSDNHREPFGGKQLLLVGDIFQLEPVVTQDMRAILRRFYKQFFFFNAYAFSRVHIVPIELRKIYRQTDNSFISLLDKIRINRASLSDINALNTRLNPDFKEKDGDFIITLATRRDTVDVINDEHMSELPAEEQTYVGVIDGIFPSQNLPTAKDLTVKEGAQIIFIRNDMEQRWINGTLGRISIASPDCLEVELESGDKYVLNEEQWENMQYVYDEKEKRVKETVLGTFRQYPIKPAWALTVHKSQGLTFNNIIIDFSGGAFSSGQTYVALSRCTSLQGINLRQPISERDIIVNTAVVDFSRQFNNQSLIDDALRRATANANYIAAAKAFDNHDFKMAVESLATAVSVRNDLNNVYVQRLIRYKLSEFFVHQKQIDELNAVIANQSKILHELALEYTTMGNDSLIPLDMVEDSGVGYGGKKKKTVDSIAIKSAIANFDKAVSIDAGCTPAMLGKARLYFSINEPEAAVEELNKVIAINRNDSEANRLLADHYLAEQDYLSAIKALKRAMKGDKMNPVIHESLADIYEKLDMVEISDAHRSIAKRLRSEKRRKSKKK
ncbi:MAG: AAA family ATPase [Muribaculaceae bacterium]|jgi:tetratricopeptide (TPR) repeat protein|nr:AAA family ATPase [Muribaculaceae bacterium]